MAEVTQVFRAIGDRRVEASAALMPLVYDELRRLRHGGGSTALVPPDFRSPAIRLEMADKKNGWGNESPADFVHTGDQVAACQFDCIAK